MKRAIDLALFMSNSDEFEPNYYDEKEELQPKTFGEKIANKISNYFSLEEVKKRKAKRQQTLKDLKKDVNDFFMDTLKFKEVGKGVENMKNNITNYFSKEKIEERKTKRQKFFETLKSRTEKFFMDTLRFSKAIEKGKEIVEKVGKSIDNAKLYFTDRVKYLNDKKNKVGLEYKESTDKLLKRLSELEKEIKGKDLNEVDIKALKEYQKLEKVGAKKDKEILKNLEKIDKQIEKEEKKQEEKAEKQRQKEEIANIKEEINGNIGIKGIKRLKENIKDLKNNIKTLKNSINSSKKSIKNFKRGAIENNVSKVINLISETDKDKSLEEEKNKVNIAILKEKQALLKQAQKAKVQMKFSNNKEKLQNTLNNLKKANEGVQKAIDGQSQGRGGGVGVGG